MATAVLDIELTELPPELSGMERFSRALVLIRLRGRPVGRAWLDIEKGRVSGAELRRAMANAADWPLLERWLHDYLNWDERSRPNFIPPRATVAVCTRDRPEDLRRCLDALMALPDDGQEVLVIDNCPSNEAAARLVEKYPRVRYLRENRPGLDVARNRALREARHEIIAFTDDDAAPDPGWLRALLSNFQDPLVLCVTGLTMPMELETEAQVWFERYSPFGRGFWRILFSRQNVNPLAAGRVGAGTNMALRRSVLDSIGPFDEALDAGTPTFSGGDTDMFSRILARGYKIIYDPFALSRHRHKRTWEELRRTLFGYGVGVYSFWTGHLLRGELGILKIAGNWLFKYQLKAVACSLLRRPKSIPLDLLLAELGGCAVGPLAYYSSRRLWHRKLKIHD